MIMNSKHDEILKICEQKLKYFNYSPRTVEMYCHYIEKFLIHTSELPTHSKADGLGFGGHRLT